MGKLVVAFQKEPFNNYVDKMRGRGSKNVYFCPCSMTPYLNFKWVLSRFLTGITKPLEKTVNIFFCLCIMFLSVSFHALNNILHTLPRIPFKIP